MDSAPITENQIPLPQQKLEPLQDKPENEEQFKAAQASRRSRKDIEGRDFICGCGKKYLSYPALYTHIKTKHDGKQPEGTMKYSTTVPPKKSKTKLEQEHINYLASQVKRQDLRLLDLLPPKFYGVTPMSSRLKSKILEKPLTDTYHNLLKTTSSPLKLTKQSTLEQHLVAWLIGTGDYVNEKLHDQYQWFARTVKECYYQMGNEVYNKCFSKKDGGLCYVPNFKVERVKYLPLICDFYVRFFLVYEYTDLNANLMELILTDFCHWLNRRKCTFIEIILNKEYKLTSPLKIQERQEDEEKCDISELIEPESQKEEDSKEVQKLDSNQENENENQENENGVEFLQNEEANQNGNANIVQQRHENNIIEAISNAVNQINELKTHEVIENGHSNLESLQKKIAEQSSQVQQRRQAEVNGNHVQGERVEQENSEGKVNQNGESDQKN